MVKNRSRRKYVCQELIVAVDSDTDVLSRLRICRVLNDEFRRVGALTADQRTADGPCGWVERHSLRQRRKVGIAAYRIGVRGRTAAADDCAACICRSLGSTWAR